MLCEERKLDQLWNDYGRYAPEMEKLDQEEEKLQKEIHISDGEEEKTEEDRQYGDW